MYFSVNFVSSCLKDESRPSEREGFSFGKKKRQKQNWLQFFLLALRRASSYTKEERETEKEEGRGSLSSYGGRLRMGKKPGRTALHKRGREEDEERKIEEAEGYATQGAQKETLKCTQKS